MGNKNVPPLASGAKYRLDEYQRCAVAQINEALQYFRTYDQRYLTVAVFNDCFGQLFRDAEAHFHLFAFRRHQSGIYAISDDGEDVVDSLEFLIVMCLLSNATINDKIGIIHKLKADNANRMKRRDVFPIVRATLQGFGKLFNTAQNVDDSAASTYISKALALFARNATASSNVDDGGISSQYFSSGQLFQFTQDNTQINRYIEAVHFISQPKSRLYVNGLYLQLARTLGKTGTCWTDPRSDININIAMLSKQSASDNVFWQYNVLDCLLLHNSNSPEAALFSMLPELRDTVCVFAALDLLMLTGFNAAPIYQFSSDGSVAEVSGLKQFCGMADLFTVLVWIAKCCPSSSVGTFDQTHLLADDSNLTSAVDKGLDVNGEEAAVVDSTKSRPRRGRDGDAYRWPVAGEAIILSDIRHAIDVNTSSGVQQMAKHILSPHCYMFSVIYMIAQGFRSVPIAEDDRDPTRVTQVLSELDVVCFLDAHSSDLFRGALKLPLTQTGLMKRPVVFKARDRTSTCLSTLSKKCVDTGFIVDENGKLLGRLSTSVFISAVWAKWRHELLCPEQPLKSPENIKEIMRIYAMGRCKVFERPIASSGARFAADVDFFSILELGLEECCKVLGIELAGLDAFVKEFDPPPRDDLSRRNYDKYLYFVDKIKSNVEPHIPDDILDELDNSDYDASDVTEETDIKGSDSLDDSESGSGSESSESDSSSESESSKDDFGESESESSSSDGSSSDLDSSSSSLESSDASSSSSPTDPAVVAARIAAEEKHRAKLLHRVFLERSRVMAATEEWFRVHGAVLESDTLAACLTAMKSTRGTRAVVVGTAGEVVGVITVVDICRALIRSSE